MSGYVRGIRAYAGIYIYPRYMQPHILLISLVPGVGGLWSVSYLHGVVIVSATKWKFVAALLMALPRPP